MNDFKLYGKCFRCKKNKLFIRRAKVYVKQLKQTATLKNGLMCGNCIRITRKVL